jgi:16S rRNA C967 or C1407 C5-methylase (RsmB/RsmF family)
MAQSLADEMMTLRSQSSFSTLDTKPNESCMESTSPTSSYSERKTATEARVILATAAAKTKYDMETANMPPWDTLAPLDRAKRINAAMSDEPPAPRVPRPKNEVDEVEEAPSSTEPGLETYEPGGERETDDDETQRINYEESYIGSLAEQEQKDVPF